MIEARITPPQWLELDPVVRQKLVVAFDLKKSGIGHMVHEGGRSHITSDGYTHQDLSVITVERMQEILDTKESDFFKLFNTIIDLNTEEVEVIIPQAKPTQGINVFKLALEAIYRDSIESGIYEDVKELVINIFNVKENKTNVPEERTKGTRKETKARDTAFKKVSKGSNPATINARM